MKKDQAGARRRSRRRGESEVESGDPAALRARRGGALLRWGTWQTRMLMYRVARRGAILMAGNTPRARRRFTRLRRRMRL